MLLLSSLRFDYIAFLALLELYCRRFRRCATPACMHCKARCSAECDSVLIVEIVLKKSIDGLGVGGHGPWDTTSRCSAAYTCSAAAGGATQLPSRLQRRQRKAGGCAAYPSAGEPCLQHRSSTGTAPVLGASAWGTKLHGKAHLPAATMCCAASTPPVGHPGPNGPMPACFLHPTRQAPHALSTLVKLCHTCCSALLPCLALHSRVLA